MKEGPKEFLKPFLLQFGRWLPSDAHAGIEMAGRKEGRHGEYGKSGRRAGQRVCASMLGGMMGKHDSLETDKPS